MNLLLRWGKKYCSLSHEIYHAKHWNGRLKQTPSLQIFCYHWILSSNSLMLGWAWSSYAFSAAIYALKYYHFWGSVFLELDRHVSILPKVELENNSAYLIKATSCSARDPFKKIYGWIKFWIYSDSTEFFCLKGGLNGSSLAKAGEFAATDLNNSDLPYFFTHSSGRTWVRGVEICKDCFSELNSFVALKTYAIFTSTCSLEVAHLSRDMATRVRYLHSKKKKKNTEKL